jgi:hypothetical protein
MRHALFIALCCLSALTPVYGQSRAKGAVALVIPISGSAEGALGTFWRTDLNVRNLRDVEQRVTMSFNRAESFSYGPDVDTDVILPPNSTTTFPDVVAALFHESGLGVIYINPDFYDNYDPGAQLAATYRSWTKQPGGTGTSSQSASALDMFALSTGVEARVAIGIRHDADFRCNVGINNIDYYYPRTFRVTASSPAGSVTTTVNVLGYSVTQVALPPANLGYVTVTIEPIDGVYGRWTAYATSIDNTSGDSWLENAVAR